MHTRGGLSVSLPRQNRLIVVTAHYRWEKHSSLKAVAAVNSFRISVIIPALNEAGCIARTLDRLQAMRRRGHEVVVVDGGSDDETMTISHSLADQVIRAPRGRSNQMRAGAVVANGSVIWFLHADTLPVESADLLILEVLVRRSTQWGRFDILFSGDRFLLKVVALLMNFRARVTGIATGDQGIFMTRTLYEKVGGIPAIPLMEDIALCRFLRQSGCPAVIKRKLASSPRRWETHGIVRTILRMWSLRLAYFAGVDPVRLAKYYAVNNA
ncbi:MAG: TIGR04283 family arsenosugar biosynthesis glycosyltransferase [Gammaproteobacteria bacterium]|nr:TIGR04283 family arsenosugar biosynthesis glycosyltransferase [Gammaproteobacteria bacterium]